MAGEKTIEQNELVVAGVKPGICDPVLEQEKSTKKDATSTVKFVADQHLATEQTVYYPPTSCYYYYCPGYDGGYYVQLNDYGYLTGTDASYTGMHSLLYYLPVSDPCPTGTIMGVDGHQPFFSSADLQNYVSYGSETLPYYLWNSTYGGDAANSSTTMHGRVKSSSGSNTAAKTKGFNNTNKTNNSLGRPSNQSYSGYHSTGPAKSFRTVGKLSTYTSHNQGGYFRNDTSGNYKPIAKMWNSSERFNSKERSGELEHMTELIRGPRGCNQSIPLSSSGENEQIGLSKQRGQYNLEDFLTDYDDAKFYVIKSYSEDDVYQCVKYNVWSSTLKGNKKLDVAYHDTVAKTSEAGKKCPIFLFYSVNTSGHFVGVAEMVGPVDFAKNMDFWRIGRWNGFFQVKWHIIKDIPNTELRHITLENNDNKPVTFTRDTHEIGLKQGVEMLKIFKNYSAKTSLVDDFDFYESREKSHKAKMGTKKAPQTETYKKHVPNHLKGGESILGGTDPNNNLSDSSSLVNLTKNLSLSSAKPLKSSATLN